MRFNERRIGTAVVVLTVVAICFAVRATAGEAPAEGGDTPAETTSETPEAVPETPAETPEADVAGETREPPAETPEAVTETPAETPEVATETPTPPEFPPEPSPAIPEPYCPPPVPEAPWVWKWTVRPGLWLGWSSTNFRKGAGNPTFSLEDNLGAGGVHALWPLEASIRTESSEFRFRYLWWNSEGTGPLTGSFGTGATFSGENVTGTLDMDVIGVDFLTRIVDNPSFELYISMGGDLFSTRFALDNGAGQRDTLDESVPILTVGIGLRFRVGEDMSFYMSSSALSYSQLFGVKDTFFDVTDTYRNFELSVLWEPCDRFNWGAGWRHYEVGFGNNELSATQELKGPSIWASLRF